MFDIYDDTSAVGIGRKYAYNDRSELESAQDYLDPDADFDATDLTTAVKGLKYAYTYDDQGNRTTDGTTENYREEAETNLRNSTYTVNSLNQYTSRTIPAFVDVAGADSGNVTVKGNTVSHNVDTQGDYFYSLLDDDGTDGYDNSTTDLSIDVEISAGGELNEGDVYIEKNAENFTYDSDGNLESGGLWDYVWDAENHLETMTMKSSLPTGMTRKRLEFTYDYIGRRVEKIVKDNWNGTTGTVISHLKYIYDGWNMIAELDGAASNAVLRTYVWGLDLSGTTQGAGGVGGLLMVEDGTNKYVTAYDGNGNVSALLNAADGTLEAKYEYGAFGETLRMSGTGIESENPFRFSTKYTDDTTDLIYYGFRYYSPSLGRFLNRDPIAEGGGLNLYGFVNNGPANRWDNLGLSFKDEFCTDALIFFNLTVDYCDYLSDSALDAIISFVGGADNSFIGSGEIDDPGPDPPRPEEILPSLYFENGVRFFDYVGEFARLPHQILTDDSIFEIVRPKELIRTVRRSLVTFVNVADTRSETHQLGDIRVIEASVRINTIGLGPSSDEKIEAILDFTEALSKAPVFIRNPAELAIYLEGLIAETKTGDEQNLIRQWIKIKNQILPLEAYVTFEYEIYLGEREGLFERLLLGKEIWVSGESTVNQQVEGPLVQGTFPGHDSARKAAVEELSKIWDSATNNRYRTLVEYP